MVVCLQTFIVKYLIIIFTQYGHIYTQTVRRGKGLAAGETESVCARGEEWLQTELASVVKTVVGRRLNYFGFFLRNYFNGGRRFAKIH